MTQAMLSEHNRKNVEQKVLVFPAQAKTLAGKQVFFLFSLFQMEDVLTTMNVQEVPFSPSYLSGITDWRGQVLPIISLELLLGLKQDSIPYSRRLAVIHSVNRTNGAEEDLWGIIEISRTINMMTLPIPCTPANHLMQGKELFVRGAYEWEEGILMVMNMENILNGNLTGDGQRVQ